MAAHSRSLGSGAGPGNRAIAATLLELLAVRGRLAERARGARAAGFDEEGGADLPQWIEPEALAALFAAAHVERSLARTVGHRLVHPDAAGLLLYGLGLATPEKAYRRVQALLPREDADANWRVEDVGLQQATLCYAPPDELEGVTERARSASASAFCAMRTGMLEAIPSLYGLLPAHVHETACVAQGSPHCRYSIRWAKHDRSKVWVGAALGASLALCSAFGLLFVGAGTLLVGAALGLSASLMLGGAAIGRSIDLMRQLEAVAGARRGQLALLDQADDALASKLDALARADNKIDEQDELPRASGAGTVHGVAGEGATERLAASARAAQQIHIAAGELERSLAADGAETVSTSGLSADAGSSRPREGRVDERRAWVREIREWASRWLAESAQGREPRRAIDMRDLVERALVAIRPSLERPVRLEFKAQKGLPLIECEPVQIEQVLIQLVRNAVQASEESSEVPQVRVSLARARRGIELVVEDEGSGLESADLDEVFDPFSGERPAGSQDGFGLPICLRIVERHGGELRIETENRQGARVSVLLPENRPEEAQDDGI